MLLHTVVAADEVMLDAGVEPYEYRYIGKRIYEGRKTSDGFEISRLISTDPNDYLDESASPGSFITD